METNVKLSLINKLFNTKFKRKNKRINIKFMAFCSYYFVTNYASWNLSLKKHTCSKRKEMSNNCELNMCTIIK